MNDSMINSPWLCPTSPPIPLNRALFDEMAIFSGLVKFSKALWLFVVDLREETKHIV